MEIIEITVIETNEIIEIAVFDPASNIAALDARVTVVENEKLSAVAVDDVTIEGDGTPGNPLSAISEELTGADVIDALGYTPANELIEFKATEIDDDYTILAGDVGKECVINSATDVNITVGTAIPVGGRVWFRIVGAGLPVPVGTATQDITVPDLTDRVYVELYRQPDDVVSGNEKYEVI